MDGINEFQGRLEVYENDRWGTVCNNGWHDHHGNVIVVCRQLGFLAGSYRSRKRGRKKTFLIDNVMCDGKESSISACQFDILKNSNCAGRIDFEVEIICERPPSTTLPKQGDLRLKNGKDAFEGRVEIYRENSWLSICQNSWGEVESRVACKQLGFNGGITKLNAYFGKGYAGPWRVALLCDSSKDRLIDCDVLATACTPSKTAGVVCEAPVSYGSSCEPAKQCKGNSICVTSEGKQTCLCSDETTMFWDSVSSTCKNKSRYNASCNLTIQNNCANTLVCDNDTSSCLCSKDVFWDDRQTECKPKSDYNETCYENTHESCKSNLVCRQQNNGTACRCYEEENMYWDPSASACKTKSRYNDTCFDDIPEGCRGNLVCSQQYTGRRICQCKDENNTFLDSSTSTCHTKKSFNSACATSSECQSNLVCRTEAYINRCLCEEKGYTVWHTDDKRCFAVEQLSAVYVGLQLTYNDAKTYCVDEMKGSLATWSNIQLLFENCTDNVADIWTQTSNHQKQMQNKSDIVCQYVSFGDLYNISCSNKKRFLCIHERNDIDGTSCKNFLLEKTFKQDTASNAAMIWTIVAIFTLLLAIGTTLSAIVHRRKRKWNANNNTASSGLHSFLNNAYDTNIPLNENPYINSCAALEPDYAIITTGYDKSEQNETKANKGNPYIQVRNTSTGYFDMSGRLATQPAKVQTDDKTSTLAKENDRFIPCSSSPSNTESRNGGYTLCSRPEIPPGIYNTFADMKKAMTDEAAASPYDHVETDGYGLLNLGTENETDYDISGHTNPDLPL
ncbi:uncharacterized protein LOC132548250 [Ylistrum balloti]|uniref:uncharacterized protein LOC132548250 n=1 Tax=Ylistrum balloti TaxID=509963 RepID=UPI0029058AFB|nr:uncharacterized protein LOC132548250 [Ylistrum balloti]